MKSFHDWPIRHKLTGLFMTMACITTVAISLPLGIFDYWGTKTGMARNLEILTDVLARNSTAAIAFHDADAARDVLQALRAEPSITAACIYTEDGKPFARYVRQGDHAGFVPLSPQAPSTRFEGNRLVQFRPILLSGETVGTIYIESDLRRLDTRLREERLVFLAALLVTMSLAFFLASRFQRPISRPLLSLVQTAKAISIAADYSVRADPQSRDEFGLLVSAFNAMLDQIERRDRELGQSREHLEEQVASRTAELLNASMKLKLQAAALEAAANAIVITDVNGSIVWCNPAFAALTGYSAEELLGRNPRLLNSGRQDQAFYGRMWAAITAGKTWHGELVNRRKDGSRYTEEMTINPVSLEGGGVSHFVAIKQDITQRKQAEEALRTSEARFRDLVETTSDWIWQTDLQSRFTYCSPKIKEQLGYEPAELVGRLPLDFIAAEDCAAARDLLISVGVRPRPFCREATCLAKDGRQVVIEMSGVPVLDGEGKVCGFRGVGRDITERKLTLQKLLRSEGALALKNRMAEIFLTVPDDQMFAEVLTVILKEMKSDCGLFGYLDEQDTLVVPSLRGQVWDACKMEGKNLRFPRESWGGAWGRALTEKTAFCSNQSGYVPKGHIPLHCYLVVPILHQDQVIGLLAIANKSSAYDENDQELLGRIAAYLAPVLHARLQRDAQERARRYAEEDLRQAEEKYRSIFEDAVIGIFQSTPEGRPLSVNRALAEMHGYDSPEELLADVQNIPNQLFVDRHRLDELKKALDKSGIVRGAEVEVYRRDHTKKWVMVNLRAVQDAGGNTVLHEGTVEDITDRKVAEERVQFLAYYDPLTGLHNRTFLRQVLAKTLIGARRQDVKIGVLFLDLDRFKIINDSLGHSFGDLLLQEVAERLKRCTREHDIVARVGGDEFLILVTAINSADDVAYAANRIIDAVADEFLIEGQRLTATCSIGISIFPENGMDGETLIKNADAAMYCAKEKGRNTFQFFTEDMNTRVVERLTLENSLRQALDNREFFLMYQPQIDLASETIVGLEALLRWQHPQRGLVPPDNFIRVAESSGLIIPLGEWALRTACFQLREWHDAGLMAVPVAVNVSAVQFCQASFPAVIKKVLHETGLDPQYLELELTESTLLSNVDVMFPMLEELRAMGLKLAIDDFGTGYSSLSYLRQFPVSKLKIDRSFVQDVVLNSDDAAITAAIISMAKSLNLKVIAEGVENKAQVSFLRAHQCDQIQGYYFSRPLTADKVPEKLVQPVGSRFFPREINSLGQNAALVGALASHSKLV